MLRKAADEKKNESIVGGADVEAMGRPGTQEGKRGGTYMFYIFFCYFTQVNDDYKIPGICLRFREFFFGIRADTLDRYLYS